MIQFNRVRAMLSKCAPGHMIELKTHRKWVYYDDQIFRDLPKGGHGKDATYPIRESTIRRMSQVLGIKECAEAFFGVL